MTIQRITGLLLTILSILSLGYNFGLYAQNEDMQRLYWAVLSFIGFSCFAPTFLKESTLCKFIQIVFITLVSALVIRYNREPLLGAFFMLGDFALAYHYGYFDRKKTIGVIISALLVGIPLYFAYQDLAKTLLTVAAIMAVLVIVYLIINQKVKREQEKVDFLFKEWEQSMSVITTYQTIIKEIADGGIRRPSRY